MKHVLYRSIWAILISASQIAHDLPIHPSRIALPMEDPNLAVDAVGAITLLGLRFVMLFPQCDVWLPHWKSHVVGAPRVLTLDIHLKKKRLGLWGCIWGLPPLTRQGRKNGGGASSGRCWRHQYPQLSHSPRTLHLKNHKFGCYAFNSQ